MNSFQARMPRGATLAGRIALRADGERQAAVRDAWLALWGSRLLVWAAGMGAVAAFGVVRGRHVFDPAGVTRGLGRAGDLLAAPTARWDAAWYMVIAHFGYRPDLGAFAAPRAAFFPLYPLGVGALSRLAMPPVLAGVLLSGCAFAVALYLLHRLTALELDLEAARLAVLLTAFAPMAFYFSALYSESLYLALSLGVFLCARRGRWATAAGLAALAGATRSAGIVLALPLVLLYLYGPRADRRPDRAPVGRWAGRARAAWPQGLRRSLAVLRPRYRLRRDALWLALVPLGLLLYMAYFGVAGGDPLAPLRAQAVWGRHFAGPYGGVWDGARAAFEGARQLLSMGGAHVYFSAAGGSPSIAAGHDLVLFAFLAAALAMLAGVLRRLPFAYGAYAIAALAMPLSYPVAQQPLMSLPRFLVVLFPLNMWLAGWLGARARRRHAWAALGVSCAGLVFFAAEFATWHWVA